MLQSPMERGPGARVQVFVAGCWPDMVSEGPVAGCGAELGGEVGEFTEVRCYLRQVAGDGDGDAGMNVGVECTPSRAPPPLKWRGVSLGERSRPQIANTWRIGTLFGSQGGRQPGGGDGQADNLEAQNVGVESRTEFPFGRWAVVASNVIE